MFNKVSTLNVMTTTLNVSRDYDGTIKDIANPIGISGIKTVKSIKPLKSTPFDSDSSVSSNTRKRRKKTRKKSKKPPPKIDPYQVQRNFLANPDKVKESSSDSDAAQQSAGGFNFGSPQVSSDAGSSSSGSSGDSSDASNVSAVSVKLNSKEKEKMRKMYFYRLQRLKNKGVPVPDITLNSSYGELKSIYETIKNQIETDNSIAFSRKMLMAFVSGVEFLNTSYDPFDIHLNGWSDNIMEGIDSYDDVFEELYDKYKDAATMAPELKLLFMVGGSAFMYHLSNKYIQRGQTGGMQKMMGMMGGMGGGQGGGMGGGMGGMGQMPPNMMSGRQGIPSPSSQPSPEVLEMLNQVQQDIQDSSDAASVTTTDDESDDNTPASRNILL